MENIGTLLVLLYMLIVFRYFVTLINRARIEDAILGYDVSLIEKPLGHKFINPLEVMEPEYKTFLRIWDWGCKRIVDKEIYELVKGYKLYD